MRIMYTIQKNYFSCWMILGWSLILLKRTYYFAIQEILIEDNSIPEAFFALKDKIKLKRGES